MFVYDARLISRVFPTIMAAVLKCFFTVAQLNEQKKQYCLGYFRIFSQSNSNVLIFLKVHSF